MHRENVRKLIFFHLKKSSTVCVASLVISHRTSEYVNYVLIIDNKKNIFSHTLHVHHGA